MRGDIGADQTNKSRKFNTKMHRQKMMRKGEKKQREKKIKDWDFTPTVLKL